MKNIFTKKESNDIIKEDYNPLKVNEKIYKKGSGLFNMKRNKQVLKEIKKGLDWKGKIIVYIFPNIFIKVYGIASKNAINNILS